MKTLLMDKGYRAARLALSNEFPARDRTLATQLSEDLEKKTEKKKR